MKIILAIKLALAPLAVFWIAAALGRAAAGAAAGALLAGAAALWRRRSGGDAFFHWICCGTLALVPLAQALAWESVTRDAVAWSHLGLGLGMAASVPLGRPWTAAFSASQWSGASADPLFAHINRLMSVLWAGMFVYLAATRFLSLPPVAGWVPLAAALALSAFLPVALVRRALARRIEDAEGYRWSPPAFAASREEDVDAVVVGAGLGGLTAAALLADAGLRVIVAEQHTVPGGFAHTWLRKGRDGEARPVFRFDSGVHDVSGCWDGAPVHGLLQRLGLLQRIDWRRVEHRFVTGRDVFDVPRSWDAYVDQLAARFPADGAGIRRAMSEIRAIHAAMYSEAPRRSGVPGAPRTVAGMLAFARLHPLAVRWMRQPFPAFLASHVAGADARRAIAALSGYVTDTPENSTVADMVPLFGYYLHGGYYPAGGSGELAQALVEAIERRGGHLRLKTPVAQVLVESGRARGVRLACGETLHSGAVVMNADFLAAMRRLVDPALWPEAFRDATSRMRPACSAVAVHLGVRGDFPDARPIIHVAGAQGAAGIVIPSLVDSSAAPPGYSTVEIMRLVDHHEARTWFGDPAATDDKARRRSADYAARKKAVGDDLIGVAERALPGLSQRIVHRSDASPLTFRRYDWSSCGAIYGCRGSARPIATKSPIRGLVFAGSITHGAGVEAVMISGADAAEALVPRLLDTPAAYPVERRRVA